MTDARFSTASWRKSHTSGDTGCVEVAYVDGLVGVRDSKQGEDGPILTFNDHEWNSFLAGVDGGAFQLDQLQG